MRKARAAAVAAATAGGHGAAQGGGGGPGGGHGGGGQGGGHGGGHAVAQGGGGPGGGHGGGGGQGGGKPDRAGGGQGGGSMQAAASPRHGGGNVDHGSAGRAHGGGNARVVDNGGGQGNGGKVHGNGNRSAGPSAIDRGRGYANGNRAVAVDRGRDGDVLRVASFGAIPARGLAAGCPPGLAKKNPPCVPPGQVRSVFRGYERPDFWGLPWLGSGRYFYDDGYLLRLGPDGRIGGYIPLLGGALAIGNVWPTFYQPVALPVYYESYYGLGPYQSYRYADNVIYRVDPQTAAITSIAALLTGDDFVIGRPMPIGYDVYNVPYAYRTRYYDTPMRCIATATDTCTRSIPRHG
jgi:hypothetical protein